MKRLWLLSIAIIGLLAGCLTVSPTPQEEAVVVPRLTKTMHVLVRRGGYGGPTNLPPAEIQALYEKAVATDPVLGMFRGDLKFLRWSNGQVDLLICDRKTGAAVFEDISCTAKLDRRWYEDGNPPQTFTISHPDSCGCNK